MFYANSPFRNHSPKFPFIAVRAVHLYVLPYPLYNIDKQNFVRLIGLRSSILLVHTTLIYLAEPRRRSGLLHVNAFTACEKAISNTDLQSEKVAKFTVWSDCLPFSHSECKSQELDYSSDRENSSYTQECNMCV